MLPPRYTCGDVLFIEAIHLEPDCRGYVIGLLALDGLKKRTARAGAAWSKNGLAALAPAGLRECLKPNGSENATVRDKLIRNYQLLGLEVLVQESKAREHHGMPLSSGLR
jgi:hypothetical protein